MCSLQSARISDILTFFLLYYQFEHFLWNTHTRCNVIIIIVIPTPFVSTFSYFCKHFGIPKMCTFTWCTLHMVQQLAWWWLYESKHVATFIIEKLVVFCLNLLLEYLIE